MLIVSSPAPHACVTVSLVHVAGVACTMLYMQQVPLVGLVAIQSCQWGSSSSVGKSICQKVLGSIPSWVPFFFFPGIFLLSQKAYHLLKSVQCDYLVFSSVSLVA